MSIYDYTQISIVWAFVLPAYARPYVYNKHNVQPTVLERMNNTSKYTTLCLYTAYVKKVQRNYAFITEYVT